VLYSLGNLLVFHHLGAGEVARYDILNKVFQVGLSLYTIVIGVMWSEIARSRSLGDAEALIRILRRLAAISILFSMTCLLGAFAAPVVVDIWTHHRIHVERQEALAIAGLVSAQSLSYVGAVFLNAFEQIRLQIILGIVAIVVMVPLATALFDWGVGIASVPLAALLLTFLPMIVCNVYAVRLIRGVRQAEKFVL
jgi:O-antigen/teichoic acid export membrane protein